MGLLNAGQDFPPACAAVLIATTSAAANIISFREGAWSRSAADGARPRRRGDRIIGLFVAARLSAFGTKRTYRHDLLICQLLGQSGHPAKPLAALAGRD